MSKILTVKSAGLGNYGRNATRLNGNKSGQNLTVLRLHKHERGMKSPSTSGKGSTRLGIMEAVFILAIAVAISGALYLYQVNDLASKGYEIKDMENQIADLKKENENGRIKEVEARSMYNIEQTTGDLGLVSSTNAAYLEINGPVAMK
jgi:cell division protein FtsL